MENDVVVRCIENDDFFISERGLEGCGNEFLLDKDSVFEKSLPYYLDEILVQYYTLCPNCGCMVLLDENELSDEIKEEARNKSMNDSLLFRKNVLRSELINLKRQSRMVRSLKK